MNRWSILTRGTFLRQSIPRARPSPLSTVFLRYNSSSPFGKLTTNPIEEMEKEKKGASEIVKNEEGEIDINSITPQNDEQLIEYYKNQSKPQAKLEDLIHPLKIQLFNQSVSQHGFFKNDQIVTHQGKSYKFHLTPEEIELLEPSIYLQSYRIKSSMKKATVVNRFVRGYDLKTAINQLHFNPKKMATELEKLLKRGLVKSQELGYDENSMYIAQLWTGSDGDWRKRLDIKGRGRHGIIHHRYIHLKCVLKTGQTKQRLQWEKQQREAKSKPKMYLNNEPLNIKVRPWYKW
ncbi:Mrpl22 protein [Candida orthopsilosis Co 90-125]|uniref:Mrpl22 protein n=1 Tax=Candida orthopsilosis (strain 90-125) TaxID=1136231 RepID=H8X711_CANO9|nr:Mrpl22 protein [Candida orthopsilosis Co 90-125]CCG23939.1 Mrpl22 protein [Candida orthopsilosis Co 90-125]